MTEGFEAVYDLATKTWTLTGTGGGSVMVAQAGAVPAGTKWVLTIGNKVTVTITQGATAFLDGDTFRFSTFRSTANGGKRRVIDLGTISPTSGP